MKAYHFRLASLARVRRIAEGTARQSLAQARTAHVRSNARLDAARRAYVPYGRPPAGPAPSVAAWRASAERAAAHVMACQEEVEAAEQLLSSARSELVAARREVTALERLDERHRAAWRRDVARAEQAEMDEIGSGRFSTLLATEAGR